MTRTETTNVGGPISLKNLLLREATSLSTSRKLGVWQEIYWPTSEQQKSKKKTFQRLMGILLTLTASQMNIWVDGFRHQQSPGEIRQGFWLMHSCSTMNWKAAWEAGLLHKPGPAAARGPRGQPRAALAATVRSCLPGSAVATEMGFGHPKSPLGCHWCRPGRGTGGSPDSSCLEWRVPGRNPTA